MDAHRTVSTGEPDWANCFWIRKATMKNLLMALVAVGLMVGCGGDSATTTKKAETKTTTPSGTKTETKETKETKTDTTKKP